MRTSIGICIPGGEENTRKLSEALGIDIYSYDTKNYPYIGVETDNLKFVVMGVCNDEILYRKVVSFDEIVRFCKEGKDMKRIYNSDYKTRLAIITFLKGLGFTSYSNSINQIERGLDYPIDLRDNEIITDSKKQMK